jgi:hypothetical protein
LTTKDQGVISREPRKPPPPPRRTTATDPGSYSWKLLLIKDARVHYVVLKQQPRTTHPTHPRQSRTTHVIGAARKPETNVPGKSPSPVLLPQDPTVCQTLPNNHKPPAFQDQPSKEEPARTNQRSMPPGTYLLIFHP